MQNSLLLFALVILSRTILSDCRIVEGYIKSLEDWVYVSRFCFLSEFGRYEYYIEYEKKYGDLQLLLYYDEPHQWKNVYKTDKSCQEKLSVLSIVDNQIVTLSARSPYFHKSGCTLRTTKGNDRNEQPITIVPKNPDNIDPTYFDQFLVTTTPITSTTQESFSASPTSSYSYSYSSSVSLNPDSSSSSSASEPPPPPTTTINTNNNDYEFESEFLWQNFTEHVEGNRSVGFDHEVYDNNLENSTEYKTEVEQLFETNRTRKKRFISRIFESETKSRIYVSCHNAGGFTSSRQRWWYIALANCGSKKGIEVYYRFIMTNGPRGDFWHEHFSADEMYIPPILLAEAIAYSFLLLAIFLCAIELKTRCLYHCTYRLFTLSAILQWLGIILNSTTWAKYAVSGIGPFTIFGNLFTGASEICFLLLLLLMAKGYTITRARLSTGSTVKITVFINCYIVVYITLFIYQAKAFDPGEVLNLYESAAGYGLAGLRAISWFVFLVGCSTTIRKFPEKQTFYYPFVVLGSIWILAGPILIFLIVGLLDPWVRESIVFGFIGLIQIGGHMAFLWLTWPSRANKSFPYHVKTNHIGIASNDDDGADYPRHAYQPTAPDQSVIIPLSRRTEDLINSGVYNPAYMRDREYAGQQGQISHISLPHECMPSQRLHTRLPSPMHLPQPISNRNRMYGNPDRLNDDNESEPTSPVPAEIDNSNMRRTSGDGSDLKTQRSASVPSLKNNPIANLRQNSTTSMDNDSGHLSLEASGSPNSNDTPTTSTPLKTLINTLTAQQLEQEKAEEEKLQAIKPESVKEPDDNLPAILKDNPFKVSNIAKHAPNKIILEPITHPIQSNLLHDSNNNNTSNVPRHLFTIKKSSQ